MPQSVDKLLKIRDGYTDLVSKLQTVFSTDEVISEVMTMRKYITSPYAEGIYNTLKEIGIFKIEFLSDIRYLVPSVTDEELREYGLVDKSNESRFLLSNRYIVPIRDIMGKVTALVGWYPDVKKYVTTPTYGFSKDGQFFNMECFSKSFNGDYPKYKDKETGEVLESTGLVYLVEGIFDTLSLRALGLPALGNMGLDMSKMKTEILSRFGKVIAIPDNDNAGMGTNQYLNALSGKGKNTAWEIKNEHVVVRLPNGVKDADDLVKGYYCLDDLLKCQKASYKINLNDD
jgi:DNA primase